MIERAIELIEFKGLMLCVFEFKRSTLKEVTSSMPMTRQRSLYTFNFGMSPEGVKISEEL